MDEFAQDLLHHVDLSGNHRAFCSPPLVCGGSRVGWIYGNRICGSFNLASEVIQMRRIRPKQISVWLTQDEHERLVEAYRAWAAKRHKPSMNDFYVLRLVPKPLKEEKL